MSKKSNKDYGAPCRLVQREHIVCYSTLAGARPHPTVRSLPRCGTGCTRCVAGLLAAPTLGHGTVQGKRGGGEKKGNCLLAIQQENLGHAEGSLPSSRGPHHPSWTAPAPEQGACGTPCRLAGAKEPLVIVCACGGEVIGAEKRRSLLLRDFPPFPFPSSCDQGQIFV